MEMMIGQIVDKRYCIIKPISSNILGQTYLAGDTHRPGSPQCLVRKIQLNNFQPENREIILSLFQQKVEKIDSLSKHDQLPNLLAYFHEENNIYLVEDYILGLSIAEELAIGKPLLETEVVNILEEVLEILVFIHNQGEIHGQITPSNLIRRAYDQKFVLIRLGLEREIKTILELEKQSSQSNNSNSNNNSDSSLYISSEQSQGNLHPNIDIYALGMIALRALTGLSPQDLLQQQQHHKNSGLVMPWHHLLVCSPVLADIINKMVNSQVRQGYHSASEILAELKKLRIFIRNKIDAKKDEIITQLEEIEFLLPPFEPDTNSVEQLLDNQNKQVDINHQKSVQPNQQLLPIQKQQQKKVKFAFMGLLLIIIIAGLVTTYLWQKKLTKVELLYSQAQDLAKKNDQKGAIAKYIQAININPKNPDIYYKRGNFYYQQKKYQHAIADYTTAIKIKSNYKYAYYNRALSYYELGNYVEAITDLTQTLRLNPNDFEAYKKRGLIYYKIEDYKNSIQDYSHSIRLNPKDSDAYINRGRAIAATGDQNSAISDYTQALKINPNEQVYYLRGKARFYIKDYQRAIEDYTQALKLKADYSDAYTNRCSAYLNLANYQAAIKDCTQALKLNPTDAKAYNNRGLARSASGELQRSIEDYTTAITLNSEDSFAYSYRGIIYSQMGNYNNAIEDFAQAIRLNPSNATAYYNRGIVLSKLQNIVAAIEDFRQSANLFLEQGKVKDYQKAQNMIEQLK